MLVFRSAVVFFLVTILGVDPLESSDECCIQGPKGEQGPPGAMGYIEYTEIEVSINQMIEQHILNIFSYTEFTSQLNVFMLQIFQQEIVNIFSYTEIHTQVVTIIQQYFLQQIVNIFQMNIFTTELNIFVTQIIEQQITNIFNINTFITELTVFVQQIFVQQVNVIFDIDIFITQLNLFILNFIQKNKGVLPPSSSGNGDLKCLLMATTFPEDPNKYSAGDRIRFNKVVSSLNLNPGQWNGQRLVMTASGVYTLNVNMVRIRADNKSLAGVYVHDPASGSADVLLATITSNRRKHSVSATATYHFTRSPLGDGVPDAYVYVKALTNFKMSQCEACNTISVLSLLEDFAATALAA